MYSGVKKESVTVPEFTVQYQPTSIQAYCCPVCLGKQKVPAGFYDIYGMASQIHQDKCRTCDGTGVVWSGGNQ